LKLSSSYCGLELPVPGGDVGTLAPGFEPAAGSLGVLVDMPGCTFSFVFGSAGIPAGEFTPLSPELAPELDGAVVEGAAAGGFCIVSGLVAAP